MLMLDDAPFAEQIPPDTFQVNGVEVQLVSPDFARVIITCPFPRTDTPTMEQKAFVMDRTQGVVNYLIAEQMMSEQGGVGIMVLTRYPNEL